MLHYIYNKKVKTAAAGNIIIVIYDLNFLSDEIQAFKV